MTIFGGTLKVGSNMSKCGPLTEYGTHINSKRNDLEMNSTENVVV